MPYSERTHLLMRRKKLIKDIENLKEMLKHAEEYLEEIDEIIRVKGPYHNGGTKCRILEI